MDRLEVETYRESSKLFDFMDTMVNAGRMTQLEMEIVLQEGMEVQRQAGYFDPSDRLLSVGEAEAAAVQRQSNFLRRQKLAEFHPELTEELARFIEERKHHPLPPVKGELARPGAARDKYRSLMKFIEQKRAAGIISHTDAHTIYDPIHGLFEDSGLNNAEVNDQTDPAVLVKATELMKKSLLELYPNLSAEVRNLGASRSK